VKQQVGSYEVLRVLARGGMAVVYLARQPTLDREVALKRLQLESTDPAIAQRFVREARFAAGLDHPNVVTLFDFFEDGGVAYIAMEYVSGGTLRPFVGRLDLPQVYGVLEGILAGLGHAETHGIAHRDLKPENVLITRGGGVKIADFGIARAYNALTPSLTGSYSAIGTPSYMAPEQVMDEQLGPYTDIYAVGVVAYELLAGRPPFEPAASPLAVLYCHVHKSPPPLEELAPDVPGPVCEWVQWLLAKPPSERPASADVAWQALEEIAVSDLGPYWRRDATVTRDSTAAATLVADKGPRPRTPTTRVARRTRVKAPLVAAIVAVASTAAVAGYVVLDDGDAQGGGDAAGSPKPGLAYDFDGDGRQELVLGMPGSGRDHAGAVVVRGRDGIAKLVTPAAAGLDGPYDGSEGFGTSVASGDFDRDGQADLATSAPGRDAVAVMYGARDELLGGRVKRIRTSEMQMEPGAGRYGSRLLAADFNADGFDDLVVGAPEAEPSASGSGAMQLLLGGPRGLSVDLARLIRRPDDTLAGFGTKLRAGDVDRDGHIDLIEGAPDQAGASTLGHATVCSGRPRGPDRCRLLTRSGTSSLAVADVNGDRFADILQGDAVPEPAPADRAPVGGEVRLWQGSADGPESDPIVISQLGSRVPGDDTPGDLFGATVDSGHLDDDGYADIVVAAPGDKSGAGAVTVIRGGRTGYAHGGNTRFARGDGLPGTPVSGDQVGKSVAVMDVSGDDLLDVAVAVRRATDLEDAVLLIEGGPGAFAQGERTVRLPLAAGPAVSDPHIGWIRIARAENP
jgi:predicted Ser/Thr protein kinase